MIVPKLEFQEKEIYEIWNVSRQNTSEDSGNTHFRHSYQESHLAHEVYMVSEEEVETDEDDLSNVYAQKGQSIEEYRGKEGDLVGILHRLGLTYPTAYENDSQHHYN